MGISVSKRCLLDNRIPWRHLHLNPTRLRLFQLCPTTHQSFQAKADPGLSLEEMKTFVRNHFEDFVNRKRSEVALKNFSEDFLDHDKSGGVAIGA
jgi:hypothetical protein